MFQRIRALCIRLADIEIWIISLLVVIGVIFLRLLPFVLVVMALFWIVRWLAFGRPSVRTPGDLAVGALLLMLPITLWATALPDITRPQVYQVLAGMALYYAIINWTSSKRRLHLLVIGMTLTGLGLAMIAPISVKWFGSAKLTFIPSSFYDYFPTLVPDPIHPNVMAGALVILIPLLLGQLSFSWGDLPWHEKAIVSVSLCFIVSIMILTKSRGGYMGAVGGLGMVLMLRWPRTALGFALVIIAGLEFWIHQFDLNVVLEALSATGSLNNVDGRLEVWSRALYMIQDFPLTGIGMGTFKDVANLLYPFFLNGPNIPHAHNIILQVAVDLGVPGLIAWLSLWMLVLFVSWRVYQAGRKQSDLWLAGLGAGVIGSQSALLVHGMVDAVTWSARPAIIVWAVWGLAMAAHGFLTLSETNA